MELLVGADNNLFENAYKASYDGSHCRQARVVQVVSDCFHVANALEETKITCEPRQALLGRAFLLAHLLPVCYARARIHDMWYTGAKGCRLMLCPLKGNIFSSLE